MITRWDQKKYVNLETTTKEVGDKELDGVRNCGNVLRLIIVDIFVEGDTYSMEASALIHLDIEKENGIRSVLDVIVGIVALCNGIPPWGRNFATEAFQIGFV